jgi:site-specific DNA-methyltransferase (adenine-specific)
MSEPQHSQPPILPRNQILIGDAATRLGQLPANSVDCVITSPPYFGLRDYGEPDQLGLEPTVDQWVHDLVQVGAEVGRVLKPSGSFWLNVADSYSQHPKEGAPKKSLLLGPQRLALALVADGWIMRNHVIWHKTNPMPSNVTDRLSCTHESVYLLTRQGRYYFDLNAIRKPHQDTRAHGRRRPGQGDETGRIYPPVGVLPRRDQRAHDLNDGLGKMKAAGAIGHPLGGNPGDVWSLGTAAFRGDHFATFPTSLVERPLLSTCPERTCTSCGVPWQRAKQHLDGRWLAVGPLKPDCTCGTGWQPGVVLDPFMGAATTALAAEQHHRDWLGIELNPRFAHMAEQRLTDWRAKQAQSSP